MLALAFVSFVSKISKFTTCCTSGKFSKFTMRETKKGFENINPKNFILSNIATKFKDKNNRYFINSSTL